MTRLNQIGSFPVASAILGRHKQTLGKGSPGAYWSHFFCVGGPTSVQSAAYGLVNSVTSHSRTVPLLGSLSALARSLPSGLNATPATPYALPPGWGSAGTGAPTGCRVAGFHSRTVPSLSPVASSLPSGLNASPCTLP